MRILVTNDDGIHSPGLWRLVEALSEIGRVCVAAPDRDLSGIGTAMTLLAVVRVERFPAPVDGVEAYAVQGTPADSVILANESLFEEPFDLVVSGINTGANIGLDVLSSGTVGGALQGYYRNIPSLAVSAAYSPDSPVRFEAAARTARTLASGLVNSHAKGPLMLNVNLPDVAPEGMESVDITRLGPRAYLENVERGQSGTRTYYWIRHNRPMIGEPEEGTDVWAVRHNRVSITPIAPGLTGEVHTEALRSLSGEVSSALGLRHH